ncbi:hypothetical protein MSG28_011611 [Choristoneura fumiferana]|uniref:Uncharacterized protein n=1 Tax=Choristoneura fumiferana TaxID=7141 RepID=A0ACC0JNV9_CHOFU|nr:hypothetical protein MSG28_011611 [Choristoneura fumiferana]
MGIARGSREEQLPPTRDSTANLAVIVFLLLTMAKLNHNLYVFLLAFISVAIILCCGGGKKIPCTGKAPCRRGPYRN